MRLFTKSITSITKEVRQCLTGENLPVIALLILTVVLIRLPIDYKRIMQAADGDFGNHIYYALDLLAHRPVPSYILAHSLYQLLLIGMWWISRCTIDFWQSAILFQILSSVTCALIIYFWFGTVNPKPTAWKRAAWAISLVVVAPILLPFLLDGQYFFGYIVLADYHNPSVHMLRPFALVMFICGIEVLSQSRHSHWLIGFSALVTIAATFLKPNYTLILLPALGITVAIWILRKKALDWWLFLLGLAIPATVILGIQYVFAYVFGGPDDKIAFMPFVVVNSNTGFVFIKFLLSIFFPLAILLIYWKSAKNDDELTFGWLGFWIGAIQYYLLAETGNRLTDGNFMWGLQVGLFILFTTSIRFLLKQEVAGERISLAKAWTKYAVYVPHLMAGIMYYVYCFVTPHYI